MTELNKLKPSQSNLDDVDTYQIIKGKYFPKVDCVDHGDITEEGSLAWIITQAAGSERMIELGPGAYTLANSLTITDNIGLRFNKNAIITVADTKVLTINGSLEAGLYQIFNCVLTGSVSGLTYANIKWFGATGDNITDETEAIQKAIDSVESGGTIYNPPGDYWIQVYGDSVTGNNGGVWITQPLKFISDKGTNFKTITKDKDQGYILSVTGTENVEISGGVFIGDRSTNPNVGEWGYGINIVDSSNIYIHDLSIKDQKGDCLYIGGYGAVDNGYYTIERVIMDNPRRWCFAMTKGHDLILRDCIMKNQNSTLGYGGGTDIEDHGGLGFRNILIDNCKFINNYEGFLTTIGTGKVLNNDNFKFINNLVENNRDLGVYFQCPADGVTFSNNTFKDNGGVALVVRPNSGTSEINNVNITNNYFENSLTSSGTRGLQLLGNTNEIGTNILVSNNIFKNYNITSILPLSNPLGYLNKVVLSDNLFCNVIFYMGNVIDLKITNNIFDIPVGNKSMVVNGTRTSFIGNIVIRASADVEADGDCVQLTTGAYNCIVSNNTLVNYHRYGILLYGTASSCKINDNIFSTVTELTKHIYAQAPGVGTYPSSFQNNFISTPVITGGYDINAAHVDTGNIVTAP